MNFDDLPTYAAIQSYLKKEKRRVHLLFGNGFSMSYNAGIFSYNALSTFIDKIDDQLLKKLFESLNTKNFELIMQQLDNFAEIAAAFSSDDQLVDKIKEATEKLKNSLIDAVKELHPEHVFTIPEDKALACFAFLEYYLKNDGYVFSTNYDLLPYWVLMRNSSKHAIDGFGRDQLNDSNDFSYNEEKEYSNLRWGKYKDQQTVFYLHGTLPFFDTGIHIIKEEYDTENFLLNNIKARMEKKEYPIFVTAGNGKEKLTHIMHNRYLSFCYERLSSIHGSLVTFGFNFGEYDTHIIDAINVAAHQGKRGANKLLSVYVGVYSESDLEYINSIRKKFKCKITPYNAKTAYIWGNE